MTRDEMRDALSLGFTIASEKQLANGHQFVLENGAMVNVFTTGKYNVQGKNQDAVKDYLASGEFQASDTSTSRKVFVVYGHDEDAKRQLELFLHKARLEPLILDQLASGGQTIIEKLNYYMAQACFAIVLLTPDDLGCRKSESHSLMGRARQNVVFEMGMLLAKLGREKVAILLKDQRNIEKPTDIQGIVYIPFDNNVTQEAGPLLARELERIGINIPASALI